MEYLLVVLALLIAVIVHESGHAIVMLKRGISIREVAFGLPLVPVSVSADIYRVKIFGSEIKYLRLSFYPFLPIGMIIVPAETGRKTMEDLTAEEKITIYWAGPFANLAFAWACLFLADIYPFFANPTNFLIAMFLMLAVLLFLSLPLVSSGRFIVTLIPVFCAILSLALLAFILSSQGTSALLGPVGIVSEAPKIIPGFFPQLIFLSFSIGLTNLLPFPPLDGGGIISYFLEGFRVKKSLLRGASFLTTSVLVAAMTYIFLQDILRLFQ